MSRSPELTESINALKILARQIYSLPSAYTRLYGVNGDRVADLLSSDVYNYGESLKDLIEKVDQLIGDDND